MDTSPPETSSSSCASSETLSVSDSLASAASAVSATIIDYTVGLLGTAKTTDAAARAAKPRVRFQAELDEMELERKQAQCLFGPQLEEDFETIDTQASQQKRMAEKANAIPLARRVYNDTPLYLDDVENHPMCSACYAKLSADIDTGCERLELERQQYSAWLKAQESNMPCVNAAKHQQQVEALEAETAELCAQTEELTAQQKAIEVSISALERVRVALYDELISQVHDTMEQQCSMMEAKLARRDDDPLQLVFRIGVAADRAATINGMPMDAVLADLNDDWPLLNSGFGQIALLMVALGRRIRYETLDYTILPNASCSEVRESVRHTRGDRVPEEWRRFPLYCRGFGMMPPARQFDRALIGLHACLRELEAEMRRRAAPRVRDDFGLPHPTQLMGFRRNGTRLNYAIITTGHTVSSWNEMLRMLLINLAYMRDYVCEKYPMEDEDNETGDDEEVFYDAECCSGHCLC